MTTSENKEEQRKTCGIVMPIASIGEHYSEEHWRRVKKILQRAIDRAGLNWQLVWENPEVDVIQSAILQNLYENDVVVCDVSGLNPNVMLEVGIRLSTKRPTVIVTDRLLKPPFDIGTIGYIEYQRDLEYNAIEDFIDRLSKKIKTVISAYANGSYKSFVENYNFELVTPATVNVSTDEYIKGRLDELADAIAKMTRGQPPAANPTVTSKRTPRPRKVTKPFRHFATIVARVKEEDSETAEELIDELDDIYCMRFEQGNNRYRYELKVGENPAFNADKTVAQAQDIINDLGRVLSVEIISGDGD